MSLRPIPGLVVEVAFGTNPNDTAAVAAMTSASWTDISGRVRGAQFDRPKRTVELDRFEAGTAKLVLDNTDGQFSPTNAASPHAGQLVPYRMIRIRALWAGTYYPLWQGYVERWPTSWLDPAQGLCQIECVDAMAVAAQIGMSSVYESEVLADSPLYYYPCDEGSDATFASNASTTSQQAATFVQTKVAPTTNTSHGFGGTLKITGAAAETGADFKTDFNSGYLVGYGLSLPQMTLDWSSWSVECWYQADIATPNASGDDGNVLWISNANWGFSGQAFLRSGYTTPSTVYNGTLFLRTPDGLTASATIPVALRDGFPHHILLTYDGTHLRFYDNGSLITTLTTASTFHGTLPTIVQAGIASTWAFGGTDSNSPVTGTLGQIAVYGTVLNSTRMTAHYTAGLVDFPGDAAGVRAFRLLDYADWPTSLRSIATGETQMGPLVGIAGRTLLECLQDIADTEQSELFTLPTGELRLTYRGQRLDQYAPAVTFGSNVAAGEIPINLSSLQLDYDPTLVYNDVSIDRVGGGTARVYDTASILAYFPRSFSRTSYANTDRDAQAAAAWLLDRYSQPQPRVETITIDAAAMGSDVPSFWPTILGLDLSDRTLLNHDPMGPAPALALPGFLDQLSHAIDPDTGTWMIAFQISPLFHEYFALASDTDPTWDAASTPDAAGYIYLSY